jgi:predicted DNA binding CopG/RHH family protein
VTTDKTKKISVPMPADQIITLKSEAKRKGMSLDVYCRTVLHERAKYIEVRPAA